MKPFRLLSALSLLTILLSSCHSYQYVVLKSDLPKDASAHPVFYHEKNDAVVYFDFYGLDMPIDITIHNDSAEDLYFDLSRSSFLQNGQVVATGSSMQVISRGAQTPILDAHAGNAAPGTSYPVSQVAYIPPKSHVVIDAYPYLVGYKRHMNFFYGLYDHPAPDPGLANSQWARLDGVGSNYEIQLRLARNADLSDAWNAGGKFTESHMYQTSRSPSNFPKKSGDVYITHHYRAGLATLGWTAALLGVLILIGDGETEY